nr:T9SS type A sorting domain-containing protein [Hymenobacter properus]
MFRSIGNGPPYQPVFGTLSTAAKTVTRADLNSLPAFTLTLGDKLNPLPVSLASFDAKRAGVNAEITWKTATERNNKGYEVQVSTNGSDFRTLGFVAGAGNSSTAKSYTFLDVEKNKAGDRYYRLRQIDNDGKESYYGPRVVNFSGNVTEDAAVLAYPNPFSSADQLHLTLQSASAGKGSVMVTDMTGRTVRQQPLELGAGSNDVTVERLNDLKAGVYMVRITQPNGQAQSLKVVKQ